VFPCGYHHTHFAETCTVLINKANIKILIQNLNIINKLNFVALMSKGLKERSNKIIKPLKDYEPKIKEVYIENARVESVEIKKL